VPCNDLLIAEGHAHHVLLRPSCFGDPRPNIASQGDIARARAVPKNLDEAAIGSPRLVYHMATMNRLLSDEHVRKRLLDE
jgi:hypothetical protein